MTLNNVALGGRIRGFRKRRGYSQMVLSEMVDCSPTYLSCIENGIKSMSLDTFVKLANALNVSADEILVDSLENTIKVSNHEFASIIMDCTEYEKRILLDLISTAKESLRENRYYLKIHR